MVTENRHIVCWDPENPEVACPICDGRGAISLDVEINHPQFGKLVRCPNFPRERDTERQKRLLKLSNLDAYANKTFDRFHVNIPGYSANDQLSLTTGRDAAYAFAENSRNWILFRGPYGSGKTHLAAAIGNHRLKKGDLVMFITSPDLLDYLRNTYSATADDSFDEVFERVRNADVLILDDLGSENPSAWAKEKLFQLLNHRYVSRLPTVITTNADLDNLDPRLSSRLKDMSIVREVPILVPDYRRAGQQKGLNQLSDYGQMRLANFDVQNFVTPEERRTLIHILRRIERFINEPQGWLFLIGSYHTGKTHLAAGIANELSLRGEQVLLVSSSDMLDYLRKSFQSDVQASFEQRLDLIRTTPILVLDDLGVENTTAWSKEKLFQIINYRYVHQMPTIFTSSANPNDIDERLRYRILDTRLCDILAVEVRPYAKRIH